MRKVFLILLPSFFLMACSNKKKEKLYFEYKGFSAATSYIIEYDKNAGNLDAEIAQFFSEIEKSLLFKDSVSLLNRINRNDSIGMLDQHFLNLFNLSKRIYTETQGAFDPTVYPMLEFWGNDDLKFKAPFKLDTNEIDSIRRLVGFGKFTLVGNRDVQKLQGAQLNFDKIYQGYMVDQVAELLSTYQVANYRIEIGGIVRASGFNQKNKPWEIGVDEPVDNAKSRQLLAIAQLNNEACATAGSYRSFYKMGGTKFSYTIDPLTGYPITHSLLFVTVFAPTAAEAEAYASAFMVMGVEKTKSFVNAHKEIQVYLVSNNYKGEWLTFISDELAEKLEYVKEEKPI